MQNIAEMFAAWPTDADLGRDIGMPYSTVAAWKQRGSIPAAYWRDIILAARKRGHPEVTAELLVNLHARMPASETSAGLGEEERLYRAPSAAVEVDSEARPPETGHFTRWKHLRRNHFATAQEIEEHIRALRDEWSHR